MFYKKTGICYNRSGNAEARSIYGHFRALFKHSVSDVIIEAEMRKREVFIGISAPCSNVACLCCNGSENTEDRSMQLYFRALFKHGVSML